ncbi:asparaginyl-tRNA synthetase [Annulohypoxylon truncatum]|uniref:asparaginyl-tRNA synthetase n=1 Tax=Annulohypoxylon truncatum TaxID=327061 RepID=UPI00200727A1|nr:asparaginyl-tRNA synthetase [Annulohypoxylon truncatum]KAI1210165.1 asparaginyl-tRNA synthetase [Annulohypoxylon truncatum]
MNSILPLLRGASPRYPYPLRLSSSVVSRAFISTTVPTSIAGFLHFKPQDAVSDVKIDGFVRSVRAQKRQSFVALGDGSSLESLQAVVPSDQAEGLTVGAAVRLHGSWIPSLGRGQSHELQVERATVLGPSDAKTFPIQKKYQTPEYLRTLPHLRPRIPFNTTVLRFRSEIMASLTRFFATHHFVQTHTPILTSADCEGAGEVFHVSAGDPSPLPSKSKTDKLKSFFRRPVYTTVSAQLHLEALAQALGNVWTLSPTFRAEQSDTPRHLSEFYMLEAEMSFTDDLNSVMDLAEGMLKHICTDLSTSRVKDELLVRAGDRPSDLAPAEQVEQRWAGILLPSWPRITYTEAIEILKSSDTAFVHNPVWGKDLNTQHEKYIAMKVGNGSPVFVTNYPRDIKAFYMKANVGDCDKSPPSATVECFDLLVPDFCEIAGGSMREHRLDNLLESMRAHGIAPTSSDGAIKSESPQSTENNLNWYVDLRRWGCPPHGGFGVGFDRLICYLSGIQTIHDTSAFPRWYGRCDC